MYTKFTAFPAVTVPFNSGKCCIITIQTRIVFSQFVAGQLLQEGYILAEAGQKHWVGVLGKWVEGQGCSECYGTGYMPRQRLTVVEAAYIDQSLANLLASQPSKNQLSSAIADGGFQTYFEQAFQFAQQGMTTLQEAIRVGLARRSEL
ncbi:MAG: hypothetical protein WA919_17615 [Coleofasciculaceae cyanobacterium]